MTQIDRAELRTLLFRYLFFFSWPVLLLLSVWSLDSHAQQSPNQSVVDYSQWGGAYTQEDSDNFWRNTKLEYFGERNIIDEQNVIKIQAPSRAENDALVPVSLALSAPSSSEKIDKVYLIVDVNPIPMAGVFTISPDRSLEEIDTRVRVNGYTYVRAVAETSSGALYQDKQWVKSRGSGCSAPPNIDQEQHQKKLGKMRFRLDDTTDNSTLVQLMISHPNNTGMQKDQLTTMFIPQHFVNEVEVWLGQEMLLHADTTFSISENPSFRFRLEKDELTELTAIAKDTKGNVFVHNHKTEQKQQ